MRSGGGERAAGTRPAPAGLKLPPATRGQAGQGVRREELVGWGVCSGEVRKG